MKRHSVLFFALLAFFALAVDSFAQGTGYSISYPPSTYPTYDRAGTTYGPYDCGGRMRATCSIYRPGQGPPPQTVQLDTGNEFLYIGIMLPSGVRGPCHEAVSYREIKLGNISLPSTDGGSPIWGIQAGCFYANWIYLGFAYHMENWTKVYCNGTTVFSNPLLGGSRPC